MPQCAFGRFTACQQQQQQRPTADAGCCATTARPRRPARTRILPVHAKQQRVCIIGSGAAGCTAAWSLSRYPDKYQVDVWEISDHIGGHGSTVTLPDGTVMNDCVLGGTYSGFTNALALIREMCWTPHHADIPVMFTTHQGLSNYHRYLDTAADTGIDPLTVMKAAAFGTDIPNSSLYNRHSRDIKRFLAALRWAWNSKNMLLLLCTPLRLLCRLSLCSDSFWEEMVAPIGIMFFGTGQRMADCPVVILASAFFDDRYGSPDLLSDTDTFMKPTALPFWGFPRFDCFYSTLAAAATATGNVTIKMNHPATAVRAINNNTIAGNPSSSSDSSSNGRAGVVVTDHRGVEHEYDAVVMACHAPTALKLLEEPSRLHELALGGVQYYKQSTILHTDEQYIRRYHPLLLRYKRPAWHVQQQPTDSSGSSYELVYQFRTAMLAEDSQFDADRSAEVTAAAVEQMRQYRPGIAVGAAAVKTEPAYAMVTALAEDSRLRVAVSATKSTSARSQAANMLHSTGAATAATAVASETHSSGTSLAERHRLASGSQQQQEQQRQLLSDWVWEVALPSGDALSKINPEKVLSVKTYEHPAHTVGHFIKMLALLPRIQGRDNIYFAGGWTFVDAHEFAIQSGLAAAHRLGASYPFESDRKAAEMFRVYMRSIHGVDA